MFTYIHPKITKERKKCFVPCCGKTKNDYPNKTFVAVPVSSRRVLWFKTVGRSATMGRTFCCEDHLDLERDAVNWMFCKLMGGALRMNNTVLPRFYLSAPKAELRVNAWQDDVETSNLSNDLAFAQSETKEFVENLQRFDIKPNLDNMSIKQEIESTNISKSKINLTGDINAIFIKTDPDLGNENDDFTEKMSEFSTQKYQKNSNNKTKALKEKVVHKKVKKRALIKTSSLRRGRFVLLKQGKIFKFKNAANIRADLHQQINGYQEDTVEASRTIIRQMKMKLNKILTDGAIACKR